MDCDDAARAPGGGFEGCAVHLFRATKSMDGRVFANSDGEFMTIPQQGGRAQTELGHLVVAPGFMELCCAELDP